MSQRGATLARRTLGRAALLVFAVGASSPLTVLSAGLVAMYAATGVSGVPLAFLVVTVALLTLAVGYVAMSRHVEHSAPFYAQVARVNRTAGVAAAAVALLGYNAIQIALYAFIGTTLTGLFGGVWWVWATVAWSVVAVLGRFRGAENAKILGSLLAVEIASILLYDVAAFAHPAEGHLSAAPLAPSNLFTVGVSGVLAFAMASFTGVETPPVFGEEARSSKTVWFATLGGIAFLGLFYSMTAWAFALASGTGHVVDAARGALSGAKVGPFDFLERIYGMGMASLAQFLLITSILAALSAFHATVARYVFALAREQVLPPALAQVSSGVKGGAPLGGSLVQTVTAGLVLAGFVLVGADPMATMFVWLSTIGAVSILALLLASSIAALAFFRTGQGAQESILVRQVMPGIGGVLGVLVLLFMVTNLSSLLGAAPGSLSPWFLVAGVLGTAALGAVRGGYLRRRRPEVYEQLSRGRPDPLTDRQHRLAELDV
jgi:amino acid transporter